MRRLVWDFAGRANHIVGNLMSRLKCVSHMMVVLKAYAEQQTVHPNSLIRAWATLLKVKQKMEAQTNV